MHPESWLFPFHYGLFDHRATFVRSLRHLILLVGHAKTGASIARQQYGLSSTTHLAACGSE